MFAALACLLLTPQAQAASSAPHIKLGTPYPDARRALIVSWTGTTDHTCASGAWGDVCDVYKETLACTGGGQAFCNFLFVARANGRYWIVTTKGETLEPPGAPMRGLRYSGDGPAKKSDLTDLVIIKPDGHRFRFQYAPGEVRY
jgi:hypothetical protein